MGSEKADITAQTDICTDGRAAVTVRIWILS
jgi:hypothetical protein